MINRVLLKTLGSRIEAEVMKGLLAGSGIEASIVSDDCGAVDPALGFGRGVHLTVAAEDLERATRVISTGVHSTTGA